MATVQEPARSSLGKYERFVDRELSRATRRVQFLDFARAGLGLLIVTMAYGLVMMLLDKWLTLPQTVRQIGLLGYGAFLIVYGWFVLLRPFRRRVNPYYAAVQVEQTVPDAKNSLVNWLDLHDDERLGPAVLNEIGQRAAEDLRETDVQQAIRSNALVWLGAATVVLLVAILVAFGLLRPDQFRSLVNRTFSPFDQRAIARQTTISIVAPADGDVTVPINRAVTITVAVNGRIPAKGKDDSIRLQLRRSNDDPNYESFDLEQTPHSPSEWSILVPPHTVSNGFYYRVVGGDDVTPEFRVQTHAPPSIKRFEGEFKYRPYLGWEPRKTIDPNIEEFVGTEVTLDAFTNRTVRDGHLFIDGVKKPVAAELIPGQPNALRFKFKVERDSKYRIWFTATDDESNNDPLPYTIRALRDQLPEVAFTKPENFARPDAEDLKVLADGTLQLEGYAQDDFGVTKMTLRMKLDDTVLEPKPYLTEADYKLEGGGYMRKVEYKDFVDLMKLKQAGGLPVKAATGMILECWLEAEDNFDDPAPQVGSTRHFKVRIIDPEVRDALPPEDKQKKQEERDNVKKNAAREKAEHDQIHQQDRKKEGVEDQKRRAERREEQAQRDQETQKKIEEQRRKDEARRNQEQNRDNQKNQPEKGAKSETQPGGQNDQPSDEQKNQKDQDNRAKQAAEELRKRQDASRASDSDPMNMNPTGAEPNPMDANANKEPAKSEAAKQVEKLVNQMKSDDPKEREDAAKKFDELLQKMAEANKQNQKSENSEASKEIDKALEQLKKGDSKEQQEAAKKLDELAKKMAEANKNQDAGKAANQNQNPAASDADKKVDGLVKQMNSGDPKAQQDAAKKLEEMMKQLQADQRQNPAQGDAAEQAEKLAEQMKNGNSQEQQQAAQKFAEMMKKQAEGNKGQNPQQGDAAKQAEKLADQMKNGNPQERQEAAKKLGEMMKQMAQNNQGQNGNKNQQPQNTQNPDQAAGEKEIAKLMDQMKNGNPQERQDAAKKLGEKMKQMAKANQGQNGEKNQNAEKGQGDQETAKLLDQMKNGNDQQRQEAAKKLEEKMKHMAAQGNQGQQPQPGDAAKQAEKLAEQMKNGNPQQQQEAAQKLADMMKKQSEANQGQNPQQGDAAKQAEKLAQQMKNGNPQERQEAGKQLQEMAKQMAKQGDQQGQNPQPGDASKDSEKLAQQMKNGTPQEKQEAAKKFADMMKQMAEQANKGQPQPGDAGKQAEKLAEQMKNGNPQDQQEAAKKFAEMMKKQADGNKGQNPQQGEAAKEAAKLAEQMKNGNPQQQADAAKKLGDMMKQMAKGSQGQGGGKSPGDAAKQAEQLAKDMQSGDPKKSQEAAKKLEEMMKQTAQGNKGQQPGQKGEPGKGEIAKEMNKLLEQMKNGDAKMREEAVKKFGDIMKQMAQGNKGQQPQKGETDKEIAKQIDKMMKETDPKTREELAKQIADAMKQMAKGQLDQDRLKAKQDEQAMNDLAKQMAKETDPKTREQMGQKLAEMMKDQENRGGSLPPEQRGAIAGPNQDYKNRSGDLKLESLDKETLKKVYQKYNITEDDLKRFLANQAKKQADPSKPNKNNLQPASRTGPSALNQGTRRVQGSTDENPSELSRGRTGSAPPEYKDAAEKFSKIFGEQQKPKNK